RPSTDGSALPGGFRAYAATFLVFREHARNAVRMAALMKQPTILVFTHDSMGLREDGPTHQPVEQIANLRLTPNMHTWRPCDTVESAVAWKAAIERKDGPSSLIFSRQNLPCMARDADKLGEVARGGYVLHQTGSGTPDAIIIATGSEVELAMNAAQARGEKGRNVSVVSMPCVEVFLQQSRDYQEAVLPSSVRARVAVEAGIRDYWYRFVGLDGRIVGMNSFGVSAPAGDLFKHFGITADAVQAAVEELLSRAYCAEGLWQRWPLFASCLAGARSERLAGTVPAGGDQRPGQGRGHSLPYPLRHHPRPVAGAGGIAGWRVASRCAYAGVAGAGAATGLSVARV